MNTRNFYTQEETQLLIQNFPNMQAKVVARLLDRSPQSIRSKARQLKLSRDSWHWTAEQDQQVIRDYPALGPVRLSQIMGRSPGTLTKRAGKLGVKVAKGAHKSR